MSELPLLPAAPPGRHPFDTPGRETLERGILLAYLQRQRWFGGKARDPQEARLIDWTPLDDPAAGPVLAIVEIRYARGSTDRYHVPTVVVAGATAAHILAERPETVLARLADGRLLADAVMDDAACRRMLAAAQRPGTYDARLGGRVVARPIAAATETDADLAVVRFAATHSNSAVALGGRYLLKVFRRLETGINPDIEIGRFLAAHDPTIRVPALLGSLEHVAPSAEPCALVLTQALVKSRTNGWDYALDEVRQFFDRVRAVDGPPSRSAARERFGAAASAVETLGRRTAELHRALAGDPTHPDFAPTRASQAEVRALADALVRATGHVLDLLDRQRHRFGRDGADLSTRVLDRRSTISQAIARLGAIVEPYVKTRVHGDYHLGQVLCVDDDFVILDFEGEPTRPLAERRARQSPLRDVSGMLRSFDYAAHAAHAAVVDADDCRRQALEPWAAAWNDAASDAFLRGYQEVAREASFMPADPAQVQALLELFLLDKAVYELNYEMNNRPDWVQIPLRGLLAIAEGPRSFERARHRP